MQSILSSQIDSKFDSLSSSINSGLKEVVQAIKSQPSILSEVNWTPIIQSLVSGIGTALGAQVSFPQSTGQPSTPLEKALPLTPSSQTSVNLNSMQASLHSVTQSLSTQIENLVKSQTQTNNQINSLAQGQVKTNSQVSSLTQAFIEAQTSSKNSPQGGNTEEGGSNGSSSTPTNPASATPVGNPMAALHASNLEIINKGEATKEHFGISGAAKFNLNKRIEELGFNPFVAPPENKKYL